MIRWGALLGQLSSATEAASLLASTSDRFRLQTVSSYWNRDADGYICGPETRRLSETDNVAGWVVKPCKPPPGCSKHCFSWQQEPGQSS